MPPKAIVTREDIIQAAFSIVDTHGMQSLTARSVARDMGVSTKPVYFHFDSKLNPFIDQIANERASEIIEVIAPEMAASANRGIWKNDPSGLATP